MDEVEFVGLELVFEAFEDLPFEGEVGGVLHGDVGGPADGFSTAEPGGGLVHGGGDVFVVDVVDDRVAEAFGGDVFAVADVGDDDGVDVFGDAAAGVVADDGEGGPIGIAVVGEEENAHGEIQVQKQNRPELFSTFWRVTEIKNLGCCGVLAGGSRMEADRGRAPGGAADPGKALRFCRGACLLEDARCVRQLSFLCRVFFNLLI